MRSYKNYKEKRLIKMLREGDVDAFDELYFRYIPRLEAFSKVYLKNHTIMEEVIQEVFIQLWEKRATLNENLSFKSYLFQIVKHRIFNIFRQKVREFSFEEFANLDFYAENSIEKEMDLFELEERTYAIIETLPEMQKRIFKMSRLEGINNEEISKQLNISKRTVEHHIYLALKSLKARLAPSEPSLPIVMFLFLLAIQ